MRYLKPVISRGRRYGYFDTGKKDDKGKRIYAPLGLMSAPEFGARYAAALGHRTARDSIEAQLTLPKLIDLYQRSPKYREKLSANTRKIYDTYFGQIVAALPTAPAEGIERKDVVLLMDSKGDKPAAANLILAVLRSLYKWGRDRGHVKNDPCSDIASLDVGEHEPWPEWLLERALACDDDRIRLAVHLLYFSAQRIGDVCAMRWTDITDNCINMRQQKTRKAMVIPVHEKLRAELDMATVKGFHIVTRHDGGRISQDWLRDRIQHWAAKQGAAIVPHGLRKNAVIALLECGCSAAETAAISGQTMTMVEHYAKLRAQGKLASAAILKWQRNG